MARKPRYDFRDKELLLNIESWARDGWEDKQIAEALLYNETWFNELKSKHTELAEALKRGRKPLDMVVENSLYKRATGQVVVKSYVRRFVEEKCKCGGNIDCEKCKGTGKIIRTDKELVQETETEVPPDTGAAMAWLKNRKPDRWNKQPTKIDTTTGGKPLVQARTLTREEAKHLWEDLENGKFPNI